MLLQIFIISTLNSCSTPVAGQAVNAGPVVDDWDPKTRSINSLWPGPDRATSFTVNPADEVVLNGLWPVADASNLRVSLVRPGEVITLTATELDEKADWFSDVRVRLPESLGVGEWRMIVSSETDGTHEEVP